MMFCIVFYPVSVCFIVSVWCFIVVFVFWEGGVVFVCVFSVSKKKKRRMCIRKHDLVY